MLRALALFALLLPAPAQPVPEAAPTVLVVGDEEEALEAALGALKRAAGKPELSVRTAALDAVVATGHDDALEPLLRRYTLARQAVGKAEAELVADRILVERRRVQLAEMRLAAERKQGLKPKIAELEQGIEQLEYKLARNEERLVVERPWRDALRDGASAVLAAQGDSKRRKLLKGFWKTLEKERDPSDRLTAAELLAEVAVPTTTTRIAKAMDDTYGEAASMERGMADLESVVNDWARKAQEETVRLGGQITQGTAQGYERARQEAASLRRMVSLERSLADHLRAAAALALSKEDPAARAEDVPDLLKLARRSVHALAFLEVLAQSRTPEAAEALAAELLEADEPLARAELVDHLAGLVAGGVALERDLEAWLLTEGLVAESWHLRSRVVAALATLESVPAIPVLLDRLDVETGRLRSDIGAALVALTGQDFHGNVTLWRRWWADNAEGFVVPDAPPPSSEEKALAEVGLTFFGLSTESQKVLFVLDVSGSMNLPMINYSGSSGPAAEGDRRIDIARRELLKALGGIKDGGTFNIVCYASDVWTWSDDPVTMDAEARAEATEFVDGIDAVGGTNIYGAMQVGLRQARGQKKAKKGAPRWIDPAYDTIFLLSDGVPSMGVSIEREGILTMVSEENLDLGIVIHTIGLSTDQDAVLMRSLAEQNGGTYAAR